MSKVWLFIPHSPCAHPHSLAGSANDIQELNPYEPLIALPKVVELEGVEGNAEREESGTPGPSDVKYGPGLRASARQKAKEQLEKRKAMTQDLGQRSAKQARVDEA